MSEAPDRDGIASLHLVAEAVMADLLTQDITANEVTYSVVFLGEQDDKCAVSEVGYTFSDAGTTSWTLQDFRALELLWQEYRRQQGAWNVMHLAIDLNSLDYDMVFEAATGDAALALADLSAADVRTRFAEPAK